MGKRLSKSELLKSIEEEYAALNGTLALLTTRQMTEPGVTKGGWSVKDLLGHLAEWLQMNLDWYAAGERGEEQHLPAPGMSWRDLPRLNHEIYIKHHKRSLKAVTDDFHRNHERVVSLIEALTDHDLVTLHRYAWTGPTWTLSDYLRASTTAHYLWARNHIRKWSKRQQKGQTGKTTSRE